MLETKEYFVEYGIYLDMNTTKVVVHYNPALYSEKDILKHLENLFTEHANEIADSMYGFHGFGEDEDSDDIREELIEESIEYGIEPWNEVEHAYMTDEEIEIYTVEYH